MRGIRDKPLILSAHSGATKRLPPHLNPGLEMVLVEQGVLHWEVEGIEEEVPPGHVFFTLPWQRHGSVREFEPGHFWRFFILRLEGSDLSRDGRFRFPPGLGLTRDENRRIAGLLRGCSYHTWLASGRLAWSIRELVNGMKSGDDPAGAAQRSLACLSIAELARIIQSEPREIPSYGRWRIRKTADEIERRFQSDWSLDEMMRSTGLRKSQFLLEFRRETGDSPRTFLNRKRVEAARCLLAESERSITEVAHACGFSSSQRFATVFRKFTGESPSTWRQRARGCQRREAVTT